MDKLPDWSNNRLVVGLILSLVAMVVATLQGNISWLVPSCAIILYGMGLFAVLHRSSLMRIWCALTGWLPSAFYPIVRVLKYAIGGGVLPKIGTATY